MTGKSSLFRGVTLFRPTQKWRAQVLLLGMLPVPISVLVGVGWG
jgi:hypothetical protein